MKQPKPKGPFKLIVWGTYPDALPCAVKACPPHLPADVWRLPGETLEQLVNRAKHLAVGQGVAVTTLVYPGDVRH